MSGLPWESFLDPYPRRNCMSKVLEHAADRAERVTDFYRRHEVAIQSVGIAANLLLAKRTHSKGRDGWAALNLVSVGGRIAEIGQHFQRQLGEKEAIRARTIGRLQGAIAANDRVIELLHGFTGPD